MPIFFFFNCRPCFDALCIKLVTLRNDYERICNFVVIFNTGSSPGAPTGSRPPYPGAYTPSGGISGGQSSTPYPVNQPNYPVASTQSSYRSPGYPPPVTAAHSNLMTTNSTTTSSSNTNEDLAVKASLRSAVEDKIRRRTRALFEQAQVSHTGNNYFYNIISVPVLCTILFQCF